MFIRELAEKTSLTPHTIRFYEKAGLLNESHIQRGKNNYRQYSKDAVERLLLIRFGQSVGFTLSEIKSILEVADTHELSIEEQDAILHQKLADIERKIAELEQIKALIISKIEAVECEEAAQIEQALGNTL